MDIARRIQSLLDAFGYSQNRLSSECGVSQSFMSQILSGKKSVSLDTLEQICNAFSITLSEFFQDNDMDIYKEFPPYIRSFNHYCKNLSYDEVKTLRSVAELFPSKRGRVLGQHSLLSAHVPGIAAAGHPIYDEIDKEIIAPEKYLDEDRYLIVEAKGDSMIPRICDGDFVVVERDTTPASGEIALVKIDGSAGVEYTIKLFYSTPDGFELRSLNPDHKPLKYPDSQVLSAERVVHIIQSKR